MTAALERELLVGDRVERPPVERRHAVRCDRRTMLGRLVFLVSSIDLPVEADSLPLHVVSLEPLATERIGYYALFLSAE